RGKTQYSIPFEERLQKKGGEPKPPSVSCEAFLRWLLTQVFTRRRAARDRGSSAARSRRGDTTRAGAGRIRDHQRQVAHGEITRAKIADERKAVSILEPANRDHITREPARHVVEGSRYERGEAGSRRNIRCRRGPREGCAEPVQGASAALRRGAEW